MSFTATDKANATKYALNRHKHRLLQKMIEKYPQVFTHMKVKIENSVDFYVPDKLKDTAISIDIQFTQKACENLACNAALVNGDVCKPSDATRVYRIGDDGQWGLNCQPACYNTSKDVISETLQMVDLEWNDADKCKMMPVAKIWSEKPAFRSKERYEVRVNDLHLGFNRTKTDQTQAGFKYQINEYYCKAFFRNFEVDGGVPKCTRPWYRKYVGDILIGEQVINMIKSVAVNIENKGAFPNKKIPAPTNLPSIPDGPPEHLKTPENWYKDVDENFQLPPLKELYDKNYYYNPPAEKTTTTTTTTAAPSDLAGRIALKIKEILQNILESLLTKEFWQNLGLGIAYEVSIKGVIGLTARYIMQTWIPNMMDFVMNTVNLVGIYVYKTWAQVAFTNFMTQSLVGRIANVAIKVATTMVQISTVIGIALLVSSILDLVLTFWDPLGFNNIQDQEFVDRIMRESEHATRRDLKSNDTDMTFELAAHILLTKKEMEDLSVPMALDTLVYMNELDVNSDGSVIFKGDLVELGIAREELTSPSNIDYVVPKNKFAMRKEYEQKHADRLKALKVLQTAMILSSGVAVFMLLMRVFVAAAVFFVLACVVTFAQFYYVTNDYGLTEIGNRY